MPDPEEMNRRVGTTLRGKWTLEKLLGAGGCAAVYSAVHTIGRRDAIKILHPELARIAEVRARFEQEAHAVNRFRHPGAVEIRDIDVTEDGAPFLVMEMLEGEPLAQKLRRDGAQPVERVLTWADELLDVLAAAHAQGIVHRDIKPDNLFIQENGRLKVLDFGIARVRSGAGKAMKTQTGTTIGTVSYMAPEQARGEEIDARADVYAVGATMFRMLANRRVHEAESDFERLKKVSMEPAPPLATVAPAVPRAVCAVIDRALAFRREDRYESAQAMQREVRDATQALASPGAAALPPASAASPATVSARAVAFAAPEPTRVSGPAPAPPIAPMSATQPADAAAPFAAVPLPPPPAPPASMPLSATQPGQRTPTRVVTYDGATRTDATMLSAGTARDARRRLVLFAAIGAGALVFLVVAAVIGVRMLAPSTAPAASASSTSAPSADEASDADAAAMEDDAAPAVATGATAQPTPATHAPAPAPTHPASPAPAPPPPPPPAPAPAPAPSPAPTHAPPPAPAPAPAPPPPGHGHGHGKP